MKNTGIVVRTWNDAPISRRDSDGYADATAMCQANGKLWGNYRQLDRTTDYITALADATGLQPAQLIISTKGGPAHLQGTWIHPRLAVDLARWISPAFAVWMDGWFLDAVAAPQKLKPRPVASLKHTSTCVYCGASFKSSKPGIMYCSGRCTVAAHRCRKQGKPYPFSLATAPSLPTRTTPLFGPRPTDAELASQLHREASETLDSMQFELELLNDPSTSPVVKVIAQELNATAHRLTKIAAALTAVA